MKRSSDVSSGSNVGWMAHTNELESVMNWSKLGRSLLLAAAGGVLATLATFINDFNWGKLGPIAGAGAAWLINALRLWLARQEK